MSTRSLLGKTLPANARRCRFAIGSAAAAVALALIGSAAFAPSYSKKSSSPRRSAARTSRMCRSPSRPSPPRLLRSKDLSDIHSLSNLTPNVNLDGGAPFSGDTFGALGLDPWHRPGRLRLQPRSGRRRLPGRCVSRAHYRCQPEPAGCGSHRNPQGSAGHAVRTQHHRWRDQYRHPYAGHRIDDHRQRDRGPVQPPRRFVERRHADFEQRADDRQRVLADARRLPERRPLSAELRDRQYARTKSMHRPTSRRPPGTQSSSSNGGQNVQAIRGKLLWHAIRMYLDVTVAGDYTHEDQSGMANTVQSVTTANATDLPGRPTPGAVRREHLRQSVQHVYHHAGGRTEQWRLRRPF